MSFDLFMDEHQVQALVICLLASLIWAPIVLLIARTLGEGASIRTAQAIWIGALTLSVAPAALAPGLAGIGVSLRAAPQEIDDPTVTTTSVDLDTIFIETTEAAEERVAFATATTRAVAKDYEDAAPTSFEVRSGSAAMQEVPPGIVATLGSPEGEPKAERRFAVPEWRSGVDLLASPQAFSIAAILYGYGVLLAALIWLSRSVGLHWVASTARPVRDPKILAGVEAWRARIGVRGTPRLRRTPRVSSVCVFGVWRPTVLIPHDIETRVSQDDVVIMCAHELAHIRRRDTQLFFATTLVRALFWFNPAVKAIAAHVEQAAEEAADAQVLSRGVDRKAYASCFIASLRFAAEKAARRPAMTPTFIPVDRRGRRRRLDAILHEKHRKSAPIAARSLAAGAALAMAICAVAQAGFAVSPTSIENRPAFVADLQELLTLPSPASLASPKVAEVDVVAAPAPEPSPAPTPAAAPEPEPVAAVKTAQGAWDTPQTSDIEFIAPAKGRISLGFGAERPFTTGYHKGVDIVARKGTAVVASGAGIVRMTDAKGRSAYGKMIKIDHGEGVYTKYAHLSRIDVETGDKVAAGQLIAAVGNTGQSTGPHLHFEVYRDGRPVDPMAALSDAAAAKLGSKRTRAPSAPRLKAAALDGSRTARAARARKPVRLAFSTANRTPGIAKAAGDALWLDAAGKEIAARLEVSLLQDAVNAADAQDNAASGDVRARGAFAKMEAELADARARRASAKAKRNAETKAAQARVESASAQRRVTIERDSSAAEEARRIAAEERRRAAEERARAREERAREREAARVIAEKSRARAWEEAEEARALAEARRRDAQARAEEHADRIREQFEEQFCCDVGEDIEEVIHSSIESAFETLADIEVELNEVDISGRAAEASQRALETARAALAGAGQSDALAAARAKIADQEAEIARLRAELATAARAASNDRDE